MAKFRPFSQYSLSLSKRSDGKHNLQADSPDGSYNIEITLTSDQAFELLSKGRTTADARVNGELYPEQLPVK